MIGGSHVKTNEEVFIFGNTNDRARILHHDAQHASYLKDVRDIHMCNCSSMDEKYHDVKSYFYKCGIGLECLLQMVYLYRMIIMAQA